MQYDLFTARSATQAQRMARVLGSGGIRTVVQRLPVELARQGCAYGVRVDTREHEAAMRRLRQMKLRPERVFRRDDVGYREVTI